jgi:hypothetical protein
MAKKKKKTQTKKSRIRKARSNKRPAKTLRSRKSVENAGGTSRGTAPRFQLPPPDSDIQ